MFMVVSESHICRNVTLWACEREHEQVNPMESFQEYLVDIDGILIDT
jgi:hypothetical protein